MISETLKLEVDGASQVNALAKALERYAKAHASAAAFPQIAFGDIPSGGRASRGRGSGGSSGAGEVAAKREEARSKREREAAEKHVAGIKDRYFRDQQRDEERAAKVAERRQEQDEKRALKDVEKRAKAEHKAKTKVEEEKQSGHLLPALGGLADVKAGIDIITSAAEKAYAVVSKVVGVVFDAGRAVLDAQAMREDLAGGLELITKSSDETAMVMAQISATSDALGRSRVEIGKQFVEDMGKGLSASTTDELIKRLADLQEVNPSAPIQELNDTIATMSAKGSLGTKTLNALAQQGIQTSAVYEALAVRLNKPIEQIKALVAAGKVTGAEGVDAVLEAIKQKTGGGKAGDVAARESMDDIAALIGRIEDIPKNVLFDLDVGPGVDSVKGTLREIIHFFDTSTDSGKEVRTVMSDTFNAIAEGLFGIDTSKAGGISEVLQQILDVVKDSKNDIRDFAALIRLTASGLASLFALLEVVQKGPDAQIWKDFGDGFAGVVGQIGDMAGQMWDAGANLISSLAGGITSSAQSVIDAVTSSVGGAISWAKQLLGIASPSKVFTQIGAYTSQGFAQGIAQNDNAVSSAAGAMAARAVGGAAGAAFPNTAAPGGVAGAGQAAGAAQQGAGGPMVININVQIMGGRGVEAAQAEGQAAGRAIRDEIDAYLPIALRRRAA